MQNRTNEKRQTRNAASRKARAEGRGKSNALFNINTGKYASKGAAKSEQNITFNAYVKRHVKASNINKMTYVDAKTGKPVPGITKNTHQRGKHTMRYTWLVNQKYAEFSEILEQGGDLPPAPSRMKYSREKTQAAAKRKADQPPTLSNSVPPRTEASSVSADQHSSLMSESLTEARFTLDLSINTTPSAASSISAPILPPASHRLPMPLDTSLNSACEASVPRILPPMASPTDQAGPLPAPDLETFVDNMLLAESPFVAESDAPVLASLTESDLTAQTAITTGEQAPLLAKNPSEKQVEMDFDLYFSDTVTPQSAISPLPTTPLYDCFAEAADAGTRSRLESVISAAQDSFEQDTRRKRKPNFHSFFQPKESERIGHASRKAKTMPSDGSVEHSLPEADAADSIGEVAFIPSSFAKMPTF